MQFTKECLKEKKKILIYGASVYGELALRGLEGWGIKPFCFVDRASFGGKYFDYPVISPNEITKFRDGYILIASADFYYEIFNFLEAMDCKYIYDISEIISSELDIDCLSSRAKEMHNARENYNHAVRATDLTIIHLGFCVSERCTLKCKDCSFLMQYYGNPQDIDLEKYKSALDRFIEVIDYIAEFRIYGGEPFVNKKMYKLLEWYKDCEKINTLSIYTNGTIIPERHTLKHMKNKKVKVHISDYDHNREKIKNLVKFLEEEEIEYFIRNYDLWQQAGNLKKRDYSQEKVMDMYSKCFATNCYSFLKGKFYSCPRAAHSVNLGVLDDNSNDVVDFTDFNVSIEEQRVQLRKLMHNRKYLEACKFCDGLDNHTNGVQPAIQIKKPLKID